MFLWLVLSWKWIHRTGNLAATDQVLAHSSRGVIWLLRLLGKEVVGQSTIVIYGLATVCLYTQPLSLLNVLVHFSLIVPALCVYNCKILVQSKYLTPGDYW